jgi:hypothetical protein
MFKNEINLYLDFTFQFSELFYLLKILFVKSHKQKISRYASHNNS